MTVKNRPGVWYMVYITECPLCGHTDENRERKDPPAPEDKGDQYSFIQVCCYNCYF